MENWRKYLTEAPEQPLKNYVYIYDRDLVKIPLSVFEFKTMANPVSDQGKNIRAELIALLIDARDKTNPDYRRLTKNAKAALRAMTEHANLTRDGNHRIQTIISFMNEEWKTVSNDRLPGQITLDGLANLFKLNPKKPTNQLDKKEKEEPLHSPRAPLPSTAGD